MRNERGQFTGGDGAGQGGAAGEGVFRGFIDRLTGAIDGNALEGTDPAVKAFQEVAQPLAAGYGMLTGNRDEKKKDGWFRRIYSSLAGFRKDESVFNKAANRSLRNLEDGQDDNPGGAGQGGFAGFIAGITSRVLPLLGLLFTKLLLPVAAVIGAWKVGQWIGEKLYAWMDEKGINTIIFDAFDGMKAYVSKGWDGAMSLWKSMGEGVGKAWDFVMGLFSSAYQGLKSLPVIGAAISMAESAAAKIKDAAASATETTKRAASGAVAGAKQAASDVVAGAKQGYSGESQAGAGRGSINPPAAGGGAPLDTRSTATKAGQVAGGAAKSVADASGRAYSVAESTANSVLDAIMPKGYRKKAEFKDVKGGANLKKYGSYTDAEAEKIRDLKIGGANTTANLKGGMPIDIQDKISAKAKKYGLDPVMMQKIAAMESGGNAQAISSTGAIGIYQFTGKTASGVGIKDRFDTDQNIEGGMRLTQQNIASLKAAKLPITAENLYMMHQLGPSAAKEVIRGAEAGKLKSDMSSETRSGMNLNYGAGSRTAADYVNANKKALDDRYALVVSPSAPKKVAVPAQTAHAPAPKIPAFAAPPPIADAPPVISPLGTGSGKTQVKVTLPAQDVGQDVKGRGVAHIVTGGISGR